MVIPYLAVARTMFTYSASYQAAIGRMVGQTRFKNWRGFGNIHWFLFYEYYFYLSYTPKYIYVAEPAIKTPPYANS